MIEHRLFTRYSVTGKAVLQTKNLPIKTARGDLIDISFKGVGLYSADPLSPNDTVRFLLTSTTFSRHIQGDGKIMYAQKVLRNDKTLFRMGIEFISVDSDLVRDVVESLMKDSAKKSLEQNT